MQMTRKADLSERQIQFIAERGRVMSIFTGATVVG